MSGNDQNKPLIYYIILLTADPALHRWIQTHPENLCRSRCRIESCPYRSAESLVSTWWWFQGKTHTDTHKHTHSDACPNIFIHFIHSNTVSANAAFHHIWCCGIMYCFIRTACWCEETEQFLSFEFFLFNSRYYGVVTLVSIFQVIIKNKLTQF